MFSPSTDAATTEQPGVSNVGASVQRKLIDRRHSQWKERQQLMSDINLMYVGGGAIKANAQHFLKERPHEPADVYQYRLSMFCYENNLGAGIGWHEAAMFEEEPSVSVTLKTAPGAPQNDALSTVQRDFYLSRFLEDCDKKGTAFVDFFRKVFNSLLLYQTSYTIIDFPKRDQQVTTRAQEDAAGYLDPYIASKEPMEAINWENDQYGNLKWIVFYAKASPQGFLSDESSTVETWYYFDQTQYRVYQSAVDTSTSADIQVAPSSVDLSKAMVEIVAEGPHALAAVHKVPVVRVEVPEGWWMGNRAYLPAFTHMQITAGLDWSLFMTALAFPILFTEKDLTSMTMAEWGFMKLNPQDKFQYAEPTGKVWEALDNRSRTLKEEIWRALYLVSQARNTSATAMAASAASKQADMQPSRDVLNGLGDKLREAMQRVLQYVALARAGNGNQDDKNLAFEVGGLSFSDKASFDDIAVVADIIDLDVRSRTFKEKLAEMIVRAALKDASESVISVIIKEFKADPETPIGATVMAANAQQDPAKLQTDLRRQMGDFIKDDPEGAAID